MVNRYFLVLLIMPFIFFTSCKENLSRETKEPREIMDYICQELTISINKNDVNRMKSLFSQNATEEEKFHQDFYVLTDFVEGDIIAIEDMSSATVSENGYMEYGKKQTTITSYIFFDTNVRRYHLAVKLCTRDDFDKKISV